MVRSLRHVCWWDFIEWYPLETSSARSRRGPATRTGEVTVSVIAGGASTGAGSGWVGDVGVLAARSPAPQRPTGVRENRGNRENM